MQAILARLPDRAYFDRNSGKLAGFGAGLLGGALLMAFFTVAYSGEGFGRDPRPVEQVYFP
ncbi:MAG: hypothetical protein AAFR35_03430 [Pseudomonadota bacterium]